jgi:hypothetical protein
MMSGAVTPIDNRDHPFDSRSANRLVAEAFGARAAVADCKIIEPWAVARLQLVDGSAPTAILKWVRKHPEGFRTAPSQLLTEVAALDFVAAVGPGLAPRLLAADIGAGLLLMEDVSPRRPLLDLIVEGRAARSDIARFAADLARLHAISFGRAEEYYGARRRLGPVDPETERRRFFLGGAWSASEIGQLLDAPMSSAARADLGRALAELAEAGPFLAFSNGDCGVNNYLVGPDDARFIDFEFAGFRHCLSDLASLYVPGPQWMALGDPGNDGSEAEYRSRLASAIPEVEDDALYGMGLSAAGLLYALMRLGRLALLDTRPSGDASRLQMVSTLGAASRTAERFKSLPELRGWIDRLADALRRRWPETDVDLASLEPYSPRH